MKIRPVGDESMRTNRHDEANSCFSQYCERTKKKGQTSEDNKVPDGGVQTGNANFIKFYIFKHVLTGVKQ
jgi:hypothetical protein